MDPALKDRRLEGLEGEDLVEARPRPRALSRSRAASAAAKWSLRPAFWRVRRRDGAAPRRGPGVLRPARLHSSSPPTCSRRARVRGRRGHRGADPARARADAVPAAGAVVPARVAAGLVLGGVPRPAAARRARRRAPRRSLARVGPALVLVAAGGRTRRSSTGRLRRRARRQLAGDFVASCDREGWLGGAAGGVRDAALGLRGRRGARPDRPLAAFAAARPPGWLLVLPLSALLALFAKERRPARSACSSCAGVPRHGAPARRRRRGDDEYTGEHTKGVVALVDRGRRQLGLDARSGRAEFARAPARRRARSRSRRRSSTSPGR